jgi:dihydrolipoamide dehydrogenase
VFGSGIRRLDGEAVGGRRLARTLPRRITRWLAASTICLQGDRITNNCGPSVIVPTSVLPWKGLVHRELLVPCRAAKALPGLEPHGEYVWTYKEAMVPVAIPKSLLVIGSGAIGVGFASFFHDIGAEVTAVEVLDRVLPVEDEEIS